MRFSEVIGQNKIKEKIIQTVREERVSHAQMLSGEEGFGGLPLAIAFSQFILCEDRKENDSCGECPSCQKTSKLIHPDLHFVFPVTATKTNSKPVSDDFITEWREALIEDPYLSTNRWYNYLGLENKQGMIYTHESENLIKKLSLKTFEAEYKVMVIWQPERMNPTCSNKLLKIIEEPPPKTLFLMVSLLPEQLLPTLLSRLQRINIPGIENDILVDFLQNRHDLPLRELRKVAKLANGSITRATEFIRSVDDYSTIFTLFKKWMRLCYKNNIPGILEWVDEVSNLGREKKKLFLIYSLRMIRENFLLNSMSNYKDRLVRLSENEEDFSNKFFPFIHEKNIFRLTEEINKTIADIEANAYSKTVFLDLSFQIMGLIKK